MPLPGGEPISDTDSIRGWRVRHVGRDGFLYEEFCCGAWVGFAVEGEMLVGRPQHVIYFASAEEWRAYPQWALGRRDEIISRIKSQLHSPDYGYDGA